MTSFLFTMLGSVRGSLMVHVVFASLALALLPVALVVDGIRLLMWSNKVRNALAQGSATCPRGHQVMLQGAWNCPACKLTHEGHGFQPCPCCGAVVHAINCPCGLPVTNPLSPARQ